VNKKRVTLVLIATIIGSVVLGFCIFPPINIRIKVEKKIIYVIFGNYGFLDLTVTNGEVQIAVDGRRYPSVRLETFLLRVWREVTFDVTPRFHTIVGGTVISIPHYPGDSDLIHVELTTFLTVNGVQRTLTSTT